MVGDVLVIDADGDSRGIDEAGYVLSERDTLVTASGGRAVVLLSDGAMTVLDENSRLRLEKTGWLSHLGGRIYYTFRKVLGEPRQVRTRFATLGIRGTSFIVYDDDTGQSVALDEGLLDIESPGHEFELHRRRQLEQYEAFKQTLRREFDDYRQRLYSDFIEYKTSFSLQANHVASFYGTRVDESLIDDTVKTDFEYFEAVAGELLDEFREQMPSEPMLDEADFE
jgi:hypothetical protein